MIGTVDPEPSAELLDRQPLAIRKLLERRLGRHDAIMAGIDDEFIEHFDQRRACVGGTLLQPPREPSGIFPDVFRQFLAKETHAAQEFFLAWQMQAIPRCLVAALEMAFLG